MNAFRTETSAALLRCPTGDDGLPRYVPHIRFEDALDHGGEGSIVTDHAAPAPGMGGAPRRSQGHSDRSDVADHGVTAAPPGGI